MLRIIKFKEKYSKIGNILYVVLLIVFMVGLMIAKSPDGDRNVFYILIWTTFMFEISPTFNPVIPNANTY